MAFFKEELVNVKAFIFDVDGVLSPDTSPLNEEGEPMRSANLKDGFAMHYAIKKGYQVAIISGGRNESVRKRYKKLGVQHIYHGAIHKIDSFNDFLKKTNIKPEDIMYMGDDVPDYSIMSRVGIPTCPADAVTEIKSISKYISDKCGGCGCGRDVIEQVLRAQGNWPSLEELVDASY